MPLAHLPDRALIALTGADAEHFLQNIVTSDLDALKPGEAQPSALLTPQGKILFDFLVSRLGNDNFLLECRADVADDFFRRLMLYRLRAKVDISKREQSVVSVQWHAESDASETDSTTSQIDSAALRDLRFLLTPVYRAYGAAPPPDATADDWHALRIAAGVAESGTDYTLGDAFPHDVLLDQFGGVGFRKGCYVGQEVVSRMQHRGTARRRVLALTAEGDLPSPGAEVLSGGRALGTLGSVSGRQGLAILRIDRVKEAIDAGTPILAGGVPVSVAIPAFAKFSFPQDAASEGA